MAALRHFGGGVAPTLPQGRPRMVWVGQVPTARCGPSVGGGLRFRGPLHRDELDRQDVLLVPLA